MARGESLTSERRMEAKARQLQALEYRKMGATYQQIADQCGYKSSQAAFDAVKRALAELKREPAEAVRDLEAERLDALFMAHWSKAAAGDTYSTDRCLAIMARRARLMGLDAPERMEHGGPGGSTLAPPVFNIEFVDPVHDAPGVSTDGG